jgi:Tfp pilus assembly protein PilO
MEIPDKRQLAIGAAAAALLCGFVVLRFLPMKRAMAEVRSEKRAVHEAMEKTQWQAEKLKELEEQLSALRQRLSGFAEMVPADRQLGPFLRRLTDLMEECGVSDQVIQPGEEKEGEDLGCVPVKMRCTGRLDEIFRFFVSLEELGRVVRVEQVRLSDGGAFDESVQMEAEGLIYYRCGGKD